MSYIIKNLSSTFLFYIMKMIMQFVVRIYFLSVLSIEYLGLHGLFVNVLEVLALSELGISSAIVFSLYHPLKTGNTDIVRSIMSIFKKAYHMVGGIILGLGLLIVPILPFFIKESVNIYEAGFLFYLFVIDVGISYFFSYKRNLLIADQKQYIVNTIQLQSQVILGIVQIGVLLYFQSFAAYIIVKIIDTFLENYIISIIAEKQYHSVLHGPVNQLPIDIKERIIKNVKAMFLHKIGGIAMFSSSNILISKFVGIATLGIYSNYYMILRAVDAVVGQTINSIVANVGHLYAENDVSKTIGAFEKILSNTLLVAFLIAVNLYVNINEFISLWIGSTYTFDMTIVSSIIIALYISIVRRPVLIFKDAMGLFTKDKYKPLVEMVVNLGLGIYWGSEYGITGILWSIVFTSVVVPLWFEPYIVFRNGLPYSYMKYIGYILASLILTMGISVGLKWFYQNIFTDITIFTLIVRVVVTLLFGSIIWIVLMRKTKIFQQSVLHQLFRMR